MHPRTRRCRNRSRVCCTSPLFSTYLSCRFTAKHPAGTVIGMQLIDANDIRRSTGDARSLSRRYARGELIRVRKGIYAAKAEWIALRPWDRYRQTVLAVNLELPMSKFCLNTAASLWDLELLEVPSHVHLSGASRGHRGETHPTTSAAVLPSGLTGIEGI